MKVEVYTHDGNKVTVNADDFSAVETNKQINDTGLTTIVIGDGIFHRTNISKVVPVREEETTA